MRAGHIRIQHLSGSWALDNTKNNAGFTLVELLISITLIGIISVGLMGVITNYLVVITRNNKFVDMTTDSQNLLRITVEELRYSAGVRQSNTISDPNALAGWNTSNSNFVIIIALPALDSSQAYIIDPLTGSPYNNEIVYFKQGRTLFKRLLANPSASGNSVLTSCPAASASSSCPADRTLNTTTENMVFTLYDQDDAITANALLARSIKIDLLLQEDTFGDPLVLNNSIRTTLRNVF